MVEKYRVLKEFGCAKVGDIFEIDCHCADCMENDNYNYVMLQEQYHEDDKLTWSTVREMELTKSMTEWYTEQGFLIPIISEKEAVEKLDEIKDLLDSLDDKYQTKLAEIFTAYDNAKIPECVKVEGETVYYNLFKLLNAIRDIITKDNE